MIDTNAILATKPLNLLHTPKPDRRTCSPAPGSAPPWVRCLHQTQGRTGLYLAISPWVVGFDGLSTLTVNNLVCGIALAMVALGFASVYGRTHGTSGPRH
ncbi:SPW repeat protein [Nocardia sp. CY41]|uniref:SPW repeat protein n=1 Tax=Nocardia sp. CY41 TaxID=2608686 RepID=UPI0022A6F8DA|nr:SPW repeat protein [Nocardia sp. CY41]